MKKKTRTRLIRLALDCLLMLVGAALYAVALDVFLIPNKISPGGVTGLAAIVHTVTGWVPAGALTLALNVPLFLWGGAKLGWHFLGKTMFATVSASVMIDLFSFLPQYTDDRLLAALFGGLIVGAALALIFLRGGSTGGFDIVAKIVSLRWPLLSIGRVILLSDGLVVAVSALAYGDLNTALYTAVALFLSARAVDGLLAGAERGRLAIVITARPDAVIARIFAEVGRGATLIQGQGGYEGEPRGVVLCAMRVGEVGRLHRAVKQADPHAFLVMAEAGEILGEGFRRVQ